MITILPLPLLRFILCALAACSVAGLSHAQSETVRIRLLEQFKPTVVVVKAMDTPVTVYAGAPGMPLGRISPGQTARFSLTGEQITGSLPTGIITTASLRLDPGSNGEIEVDVEAEKKLWKPRTYKGTVQIDIDPRYTSRLRLINDVDLEEYVASVLPREYPFTDLEGAKAMAIVIRTYALQSGDRYGADYDHTDHIGSQVYDGSAHVTELSRQATRLTKGIVLTYRGQLVEATYSAANGGHTASNEDVWNAAPLPYLRAKADPYDSSPHHNWTSNVPRMQLLGVLTSVYGGGKRVVGFTPGAPGPDGRIRSIHIDIDGGTRRTISSNEFRLLVNRHFGVDSLKSTMFTVRQNGDTYTFQGSGYGHGVGLSQWGTHEMARRGHSHKDILTFYYTGAELSEYTPAMASRKRKRTDIPVVRTSQEGTADPIDSGKRAGW